MSGKKRIKISKIENQLLDMGVQISIIKSLSQILDNIINEECTSELIDAANLSCVLKKNITKLNNNFNSLEVFLKI